MSTSEIEPADQYRKAELPKVISPEEVAEHFGWSARRVRELAKRYGTCHVLGNRMILTQADVDEMLLRIKQEAEAKAHWKPQRHHSRYPDVDAELARLRRQAKTKAEQEKRKRQSR